MCTIVEFIGRTAAAGRQPHHGAAATSIWPVEKGALAALVDLGMSDCCIARYFQIEQDQVQLLRQDYDL